MKLTTWMKNNKMSYRKLSKELGIDHTLLNKYANGKRTPSLKNALKIEKHTKGNVTCKDLINGTKGLSS